MAGIALCKRDNNNCNKKETCLRFKQEENQYSSFCEFLSICNIDNNYMWYWHMETQVQETKDSSEPVVEVNNKTNNSDNNEVNNSTESNT